MDSLTCSVLAFMFVVGLLSWTSLNLSWLSFSPTSASESSAGPFYWVADSSGLTAVRQEANGNVFSMRLFGLLKKKGGGRKKSKVRSGRNFLGQRKEVGANSTWQPICSKHYSQ